MNAVQIEDKGVETHQHQPFPSVNSDENRPKSLICHPRKQKRKKREVMVANGVTLYAVFVHMVDALPFVIAAYLHTISSALDLENVPDGKWFCSSCRCGLCRLREVGGEGQLFTEVCHQCSLQYHVDCITKAGIGFPRNHPSEKLCSQNCFQMLNQLHVESLVLPAISERSELWKSSFCFSEMTSNERLQLLPFPFLRFQGTTMLLKTVSDVIPRIEMKDAPLEFSGCAKSLSGTL